MIKKKRMTITIKLWIGIGILVLVSPLGLIIPALFGAGGAWGEWGLEEIEKLVGYVPAGMKKVSDTWKAPLPNYTVPGQSRGIVGESLGYIMTAVIGVMLTAGAAYLIARILSQKNRK